jgi:hypothetical protein
MEWLVVLFVSFVLAVYTVLGIHIVRRELAYRRAVKRRLEEIGKR